MEMQQQIRIVSAGEKYRTRLSFIDHDLSRSIGIVSSRCARLLALQDWTGNKPGTAVVEVPLVRWAEN